MTDEEVNAAIARDVGLIGEKFSMKICEAQALGLPREQAIVQARVLMAEMIEDLHECARNLGMAPELVGKAIRRCGFLGVAELFDPAMSSRMVN